MAEHPDLIRAAEDIDVAKRAYANVLTTVRKTCGHSRVVEQAGGSYGADLGHHAARRICCDCGYEETLRWPGSKWQGTNDAEGHTSAPAGARLVLTTDFVKRLPFGGSDREFYRYRPAHETPPASSTEGEA